MASSLPVKAKVISSSSCSLSDGTTFLKDYICGNSTTDPMVKGYLQNVVQAIDGMVFRRNHTQVDVLPKKQKSAIVEERLDVRERGEGEAFRGRSSEGVSFLARKAFGLSKEELGFEETLSSPAEKQGNGPVGGSVGSARKKKEKNSDKGRNDVEAFQEAEDGIDVSRRHSKVSIFYGDDENHAPKKKRRKEGGQEQQLRPSKDEPERIHALMKESNVGPINENDEAKNGKDSANRTTGKVFVEKFQGSNEKKRRKEHKKMRLQSENEP
ncbi:hypothetical protein O6H91_14G011100 [Diphasiastrum complanatum]|uniref:Uncharacterized protein n=2 Tax=Diphasiastrum complanatum TaxID=34168 RepID=A0ACC2BLH6_DIPCM|nr:hypothetical protein O6H91_14G011100 [Diphasiastrum complanatum]KAJ7530625.1 hypothetical protein O6H91_14G011100 [Diphasiastrum complanatum]